MMTVQKLNYNVSADQEYTPIDFESLPYDYDIKGLKAYSKEKGVPIENLTMEEKRLFLVPRKTKEKAL